MEPPIPKKTSIADYKRDPVAALVEKQLRDLAGSERLKIFFGDDGGGIVEGRFGSVTVRGESLDIAVLRLANRLLEDPRFSDRLTRSLRSVSGLTLDQDCPGQNDVTSSSRRTAN